jgi:hypothetical protein
MFGIHRGGVLSLPDRSGAIEPSAAVTATAEHPEHDVLELDRFVP